MLSSCRITSLGREKGSKLDVVLGELVPSSNTRESRIRIVANAQDAPRTTDRRRNSTTSTPRHNITPSSTVLDSLLEAILPELGHID